jgi:hypothetical protein
MEYLVELIFSEGRINSAIIGAVFGGIAGVLGFLVGTLLFKLTKKEGVVRWTTIIFVVCSFQIPSLIKPYLMETYGNAHQDKSIESLMQDLEKQRLFSVLFRYHPDARERLGEKMKNIVYNSEVSDGDVTRLSQQATAEITNEYFQQYLLTASDDRINELLKRNHQTLLRFRSKPALCVGYFLGTPDFSAYDITAEFIEQEGNMKADIIISAISNPSIQPRAGGIDEVIEILSEGYHQKNYNLENLAQFDAIQTLKVSERCDIAIEFSDVLASFDAKTGSFVFKNLMYFEDDDRLN